MVSHHTVASGSAEKLRDDRWLSRLSKNRAGQALQNHLACVEERVCHEPHDAALQACVDNRRGFLHALALNAGRGKDHPCGLPRPLPKFVAILNLSGERVLVYSNTDTMMRALCGRSTTLHMQQVRIFLRLFTDWIDRQREAEPQHASVLPLRESCVLINLQLPWQMGVESMYARFPPSCSRATRAAAAARRITSWIASRR